jgi:GNAT superfamily N-acetyltransferase
MFDQALDRLPFRKRLIYVFSYSLEDARRLLPPRPLPDGVTIEEARGAGIAEAAGASPRPDDAPLFERRAAAGRRCLVARHEGTVIGYRWLSVSGVEPGLEHTIPLLLEETEGYVYDVFVAPAWRRGPVNRALSRAAFDALLAAGRTRGLGVILSGNTASLAAVARYGTLVAAVEQRRRPLRWRLERERPASAEEAAALGARFSPPAEVRVDPGWLSRRRGPLVAA